MYVREAYRLLQKSIIFVENEDVELDDNEEVRSVPFSLFDIRHEIKTVTSF